ncbi:Ina22p Ecym_3394 [Eremothecium cymbalariae DBVPG|uniref:Inner membrane assembly complex subunit 22 n=1 Tax=Eremothecium cymbalariae (strain CBS 270.75 / DBVPG 7215 / KCTC 17166 / NRRL Y-17582) TaxID=931890 RepID=G8JRW2_ERECY|nr:Hypothetical protein Ecym_3394 [Eremothecium cymbalariae DBVPG\
MLRSSFSQNLRMFVRLYSASPTTGTASLRSKYDKTVFKPLILLLIVGSIATNVIEQKKRHFEMERRYNLKIHILEDLIDRVKYNNDTTFSVEQELYLVNKMLARHSGAISLNPKIRNEPELEDSSTEPNSPRNGDTNKKNYSDMELESVEELFKNIFDEINEVSEKDHSASLDIQRQSKPKSHPSSDEIVIDRQIIAQNAKQEKQQKMFKPNTEQHVIVPIPGDYVAAAEATKVSRFL